MVLDGKDADYIDEGEALIRQMRDVVSAKVIKNDKGEIEEIHVLSGSSRNPKQIVRDIESAFMAQFGIAVDHKKISVAQIHDENNNGCAGTEIRPKIVAVHLSTIDRRTEARVQLEIADSVIEGTASGPSSATNKLRVVAMATAAALEDYLAGICNFVVEDLTLVTLARHQAVVVSVALVTNLGEDRLIGTAYIKEDDREATVKATLSAVNRKLALLLNE
ncbi:hypothetical protein [Thermincola potens]|uniref:Uncharacterized protein n=1 Tax=Thermincola potens (strain JR) TaxID=635013 RepID=D5XCT1_THEPJ|nr:hypothetical protein [Thermincola potens]ADG83607.1 conserved hypothetical protein [Thermincola potens JR]